MFLIKILKKSFWLSFFPKRSGGEKCFASDVAEENSRWRMIAVDARTAVLHSIMLTHLLDAKNDIFEDRKGKEFDEKVKIFS